MKTINICELELTLNNPIINGNIDYLILRTNIKVENEQKAIDIGIIDLRNNEFIINEEFVNTTEEKDKRSKVILNFKSYIVNALMRAGLIKPNIDEYRRNLRQWDDVILGIDTNLLYTCGITSFLLDDLLGISSGNFIDSPDWVTLVLSKVAMGEVETKANFHKDSIEKREALRAVQEMMLINKCKDLEGVSIFLAGSIPPEFDQMQNTSKDSLIREQFRTFLKNLDFHKGHYFMTQDFNNYVLAEAEGLMSMYIKKPKLEAINFSLGGESKCAVSELLYELSILVNPLKIIGVRGGMDILDLNLYSIWQGKTLEDWENWIVRLEWKLGNFEREIELFKNNTLSRKILAGWEKLKERYVTLIV